MKLISKINSMSRKRQIILYIIIILLFDAWHFCSGRSYTSPEAVLYACEKGLHYGPSEKILHVERQGINALVIGKCDGGLSSVPACKTRIGTWQLGYDRGGTSVKGYTKVEGIEAIYDRNFRAVYGLSTVEDVKRVRVVLGAYISGKFVKASEISMDTDSDGFFWDSTKLAYFELKSEDIWLHAIEIEGYDENGESVYFTSEVGEELFDSGGELIYSDLEESQGAETVE